MVTCPRKPERRRRASAEDLVRFGLSGGDTVNRPAREGAAMTSHYPLDRRTFLVAGGLGFFGRDLAHGAAYAGSSVARQKARSTIMIWLSGGASHIDTWDMK